MSESEVQEDFQKFVYPNPVQFFSTCFRKLVKSNEQEIDENTFSRIKQCTNNLANAYQIIFPVVNKFIHTDKLFEQTANENRNEGEEEAAE